MRAVLAALVAGLMVASIPAQAHLFNHQTRHEDCDIYGSPHGHTNADGHAHYHHLGPTTGHFHGATWFPAGHTHADVLHDPCDQAGMKTYLLPNAAAIQEIPVVTAGTGPIPAGHAAVVVRDLTDESEDEAYQFPVAGFTEVENLVLHGNAALAQAGLPGAGTFANPYIIEGYLVRNVLDIKDTSACIVVRNNVIHSDAVNAPLLDLDEVIDRQAIVDALQTALDNLQDAIADLEDHLAAVEAQIPLLADDIEEAQVAVAQAIDALAEEQEALAMALQALAEAQEQHSAHDAQGQQLESERVAVLAALDALESTRDSLLATFPALQSAYDDALAEVANRSDALDAYTDAFEAFVANYAPPAPPADEHHAVQLPQLPPALGAFVAAYAQYVESAPPQNTPPNASPSQYASQYQAYVDGIAAHQDEVSSAVAQVTASANALAEVDALVASATSEIAVLAAELEVVEQQQQAHAQEEVPDLAPLQTAVDQAQDAVDDAMHLLDEKETTLQDLEASQLPLLEDQQDTLSALANAVDTLHDLEQQHMQALADLAAGQFVYGGLVFGSLQDLVDQLLEAAEDILDPNDAGRLILDWNGQCMHAYNNVVEDLRVNRNNVRVGYATGGVIEENRIGVVGQLRHYDGDFRENEIGDRAHLMRFGQSDAPASERAINVDGFNQGKLRDNVVYGHVDLDFHGHHHGPGFFARESHYHGSDMTVGYMMNPDGTFMMDAQGNPIPHHDHAKRWTSTAFTGNLVVDPLGYGVRFEDRDHAGDDRTANSEDMRELLAPHFHRTHIDIRANDIVGSLWTDVFNAPGIEIWSDDYSEVKRDLVTNEILDAVLHLGAERITTHPGANDGWLDLVDNQVFVVDKASGAGGYAWAALQLNDLTTVEGRVTGNVGYMIGAAPAPGLSGGQLAEFFRDARQRTPAAVHADVVAWAAPSNLGSSSIGILVQGLRAGTLDVCGNAVLGFAQALRAVTRIYDDANVAACPGNDWGGSPVAIAYTTVPPTPERFTDPLRDALYGSVLAPIADPLFDEMDGLYEPAQDLAQGTPAEDVLDQASDALDQLPDGQLAPIENQVGETLVTAGNALGGTPAAPVGQALKQTGQRLT